MNLFQELINVAICNRASLSKIPSRSEWENLYWLAEKHSLIGICFTAIERLPQEQWPYSELLINWYGVTCIIRKRNEELNNQCIQLYNSLTKGGYRNCILKGQGIAKKYPSTLSANRSSGDIDIWLEGGIAKALDLAKSFNYCPRVTKHHIDLPFFENTEVEVHFIPATLFNPITNKRLKEWFASCSDTEFRQNPINGFVSSSDSFNFVYLPLHIFHHLFDEGVGLRQIMDYYFFMIDNTLSDAQKEKSYKFLCRLGMKSFIGGLMWVLGEYFAMHKRFMFCPPNAKHGSFLLQEILLSGNMGRYDLRLNNAKKNTRWNRFMFMNKYNLRLFRYYSLETIWAPISRIEVWAWRKVKGWI